MSLIENLKAARALIDTPEKWHQGWYESESGCLCTLGALAKAVLGKTDNVRWCEPELSTAQRALEAELPKYWKARGVATFNDSPRRTHADIMALFDRAISATERSVAA